MFKEELEQWNDGLLTDGELLDIVMEDNRFSKNYPQLLRMLDDPYLMNNFTNYDCCQMLVEVFWNTRETV